MSASAAIIFNRAPAPWCAPCPSFFNGQHQASGRIIEWVLCFDRQINETALWIALCGWWYHSYNMKWDEMRHAILRRYDNNQMNSGVNHYHHEMRDDISVRFRLHGGIIFIMLEMVLEILIWNYAYHYFIMGEETHTQQSYGFGRKSSSAWIVINALQVCTGRYGILEYCNSSSVLIIEQIDAALQTIVQ